ncbi:MAG: aminopeptidase P N-terminal domain-containing protein [Bacilli bacterium]|nr:aminopeptidase P N-terminal domain-containing protein [Bacilli bacterium]
MQELASRRDRLFNLMKENSVAVIFAGVSKISSEDEFYPFTVNNCFYYLTEISQEHSVLLLIKGVGERKEYLFVDEYNELKEKWTGKRLTYQEASTISGLENVYSMNNFENMLNLALEKQGNQFGAIENIYIDLTPELKIEDSKNTQMFADEISAQYKGIEVLDVKPLITSLRLVKSAYEIEKIHGAISLTNLGINKLICELRPGIMEYELADIFEFFGKQHNRHGLAFPTIVACGKNATCLHYPTQNAPVTANSLILFDLGYKHDGYCADISRTLPVNGKFEGMQKSIYEAVLHCNKEVIKYAKAGLTIKDLQEKAREILKGELVKLKLLKEDEDVMKYYFHNVSHHLGLDTHDASNREKPLEEGNVITVEPGLYIPELSIGVRIEDDVLIHQDHAEVLSIEIPKEIADIERLFKSKRS